MDSKDIRGLCEAYVAVYDEDLRNDLEMISLEEDLSFIDDLSDEELLEICEEVISEMIVEGYDLTDGEYLFESENIQERLDRVKSALSTALKKVGGKMSKVGPSGSYRMVRRGGKLVTPKREKIKKTIGKLGRTLASAGERLAPAKKETSVERKTTKALPGAVARKALPPARDSQETEKPTFKKITVSLPAAPERKALPPVGKTKSGKTLTQSQRNTQTAMQNRRLATRLGEEIDLYDVVLEHLIDEGYADTIESAEKIMVNMSEEWRGEILGEAEKWIQKMHMKKGAFTAQAERHDMGVQEFAKHVKANPDDFDTTTLRRANLALRFKKGI